MQLYSCQSLQTHRRPIADEGTILASCEASTTELRANYTNKGSASTAVTISLLSPYTFITTLPPFLHDSRTGHYHYQLTRSAHKTRMVTSRRRTERGAIFDSALLVLVMRGIPISAMTTVRYYNPKHHISLVAR
jgi:hypothetical protein